MSTDRTNHVSTILLGICLALLHMPSGIPAPFYPFYKIQFGIESNIIALFFSVYVLGVVFALVFASRLIFFRYILILACIVSIGGNLLLLRSGSVTDIVLGHFIHGLVLGVVTVVVPVALGRIDVSGSSKIAGRVTTSANAIGLTAGPLWSGLMLAYVPAGDELVWWIQIAATALVLPFLRLQIHRQEGSVAKNRMTILQYWRGFFEDRLSIIAIIVGFAAFASGGILAALGSVIADTVMLETNTAVQGLVVSLGFAVSAITGAVRLRWSERMTIVAGLAWIALGVAGLAASVIWANLSVLLIAAAFCGIGQGLGLQGATQAVTHRRSAEQASKFVSSFFLFCYSGTVGASFGMGLLISITNLQIASVVFCLVLLMGCIIGIVITPKRQRSLLP